MTKRKVLVRYGFDNESREEITRQAPESVEVVYAKDESDFLNMLPQAEGLFGHITRDEFAFAEKLSWLQSNATGIDGLIFPEMENSQVAVTGISGLLANPVAEHAVALLFSLTRHLHLLRDQQKEHTWRVISGLELTDMRALILGTGGAAKAVRDVLEQRRMPYLLVSRRPGEGQVAYRQLTPELLDSYSLIINTTPLGMSPEIATFPDIPYQHLSEKNLLYDLVYNPEETTFMRKGQARGCPAKNGLEMLYLQAEKAWDIWWEQEKMDN